VFGREKFFVHVRDVCQSSYKLSIDKVLGHLSKSGRVTDDHIRSLFFGDYMQTERIYDEVTDLRDLHKTMEQYVPLGLVHSSPQYITSGT